VNGLPDRLETLLSQAPLALTGIDFIAVHDDQVNLDVFFVISPDDTVPKLTNSLTPDKVHIYSEGLPEIPAAVSWPMAEGRRVLRLTTAAPGDFSAYRLRLDDARLDPFFNDVPFSFKAACPRDVDCKPADHECAPEPQVDYPVDYQARDFWSFRRALLDFASTRYPAWQDRLEADVGVMLAEVMSAAGDELSYAQDRIAREAWLATAAQRRSLRRHARLVDYPVHDGKGAATWLDFDASQDAAIAASMPVQTKPAAPGATPVTFEVGTGLADALADKKFAVVAARTKLTPHLWDASVACLPAGATEMHVQGHHQAHLPLDEDLPGRKPGRWVLLRTDPTDRSLPLRRHPVRLIAVKDESDPLINDAVTGHDVTRLTWEDAQALPFELDLTVLTVRGNLVPATAGRTVSPVSFVTGSSNDPAVPTAVERTGSDRSISYLYTLPDPAGEGLVWLGSDPRSAAPEMHLIEHAPPNERWEWRRALLGVNSSHRADRHFTLDDGTWDRVVGYRRLGGEIVHRDYHRGEGITIRFGDGEFGRIPAAGTRFDLTYRLGNGASGNVAADTLTVFDPVAAGLNAADKVTNPLPGAGGADPESATEVKRLAPDAFRHLTYRAVRPEDYAEAAERLADVQRAGAAFRWTGSWLTTFVTPDPRGAPALSPAVRDEVETQVDRFRQAGRPVFVLDPRYVDIDLRIFICVEAHFYAADVMQAVRLALLGRHGVQAVKGFFDPDNFTFGVPLDRSELEAAIQAVPGVRAVEKIRVRRRGLFDWRDFDEWQLEVGKDEVVRVSDDPQHPERGTLQLQPEGGA
jgi:hypothetical protein